LYVYEEPFHVRDWTPVPNENVPPLKSIVTVHFPVTGVVSVVGGFGKS
jgi:hypothetical protein